MESADRIHLPSPPWASAYVPGRLALRPVAPLGPRTLPPSASAPLLPPSPSATPPPAAPLPPQRAAPCPSLSHSGGQPGLDANVPASFSGAAASIAGEVLAMANISRAASGQAQRALQPEHSPAGEGETEAMSEEDRLKEADRVRAAKVSGPRNLLPRKGARAEASLVYHLFSLLFILRPPFFLPCRPSTTRSSRGSGANASARRGRGGHGHFATRLSAALPSSSPSPPSSSSPTLPTRGSFSVLFVTGRARARRRRRRPGRPPGAARRRGAGDALAEADRLHPGFRGGDLQQAVREHADRVLEDGRVRI